MQLSEQSSYLLITVLTCTLMLTLVLYILTIHFASNVFQNFFQSGGNDQGKTFLTFEWTNQHGSGGNDRTNPHKMNSNVVLQYMCQWVPGQNKPDGDVYTLRNGISTNTPKFKATNKKDAETQAQYKQRKNGDMDINTGLHESWEWYDKCKRREQNKGKYNALY